MLIFCGGGNAKDRATILACTPGVSCIAMILYQLNRQGSPLMKLGTTKEIEIIILVGMKHSLLLLLSHLALVIWLLCGPEQM